MVVANMVKIILDGIECKRCGHKWVPNKGHTPRVCPTCKSPYYDKPRSNE